jgi:hypothetical protein
MKSELFYSLEQEICWIPYPVSQTIFPLSCAGALPRSNCTVPAHVELLRRSLNLSLFIVNILIMNIKKILKCRAVVRPCKSFCSEHQQVRAALKKMRGNVGPTQTER